MGEFITLTCPSCGGKLQVSPNTSVLNCQHCGTEHLVRRDAGGVSLESFARCPKCGRNDRVEKVSAILRSHRQEVTTTEKHTETYYDQNGNPQTHIVEVPVTRTQVTGLARSFVPPGDKPEPLPKPKTLPKPDSLPKPKTLPKPKSIPKPKISSKPRFYNPNIVKALFFIIGSVFILATICFLIIAVIYVLDETSVENIICCGSPVLLLMGTGMVFLVLGVTRKTLDDNQKELLRNEIEQKLTVWLEENEQITNQWLEDNEQLTYKWQVYYDKITNNWQEENGRIIKSWENENNQIIDNWNENNRLLEKSWQKAMNNWNNLYFCHRDDCVFVQGDDSYAPIEEMGSYLFKDLPKPKFYPNIKASKNSQHSQTQQAQIQQSPSQHNKSRQSPSRQNQINTTHIVKSQNQQNNNQKGYAQTSQIRTMKRCPICGSTKISHPKRQNMSCIWLVFIFLSMGLGLIFWFFTPKYVECNKCGATWKV